MRSQLHMPHRVFSLTRRNRRVYCPVWLSNGTARAALAPDLRTLRAALVLHLHRSGSTCCIRGGTIMRETHITLPELALIAGTRAALGAGLGLLLADRFNPEQRRAVGWTLLVIGALTTIPLGFEVLGGGRMSAGEMR